MELLNMGRKIFLILSVAIVLSSCGKVDPKIYDQDGPVADGDILIESTVGDLTHLNPALVDDTSSYDVDSLIFNGLVRYNKKMELEPDLAEKWTVSKDGKIITYYLRKGIKFHDGVEFTANDVLFTYKVFSDPGTNTPQGALYQDIKEVQIVDLYTVRVYYKKPYAPALGETFIAILPKHLLEGKDINKDAFDRHPIGTGPYQFVEWKTAQKIVLDANPNYYEGAPHLKKFIMRVIPDQTTEFLELLNGGIDCIGGFMHGSMTAEQYTRQTDIPKFKNYYNLYKTDELAYSYIGWNNKNPLFKEKKVRQALTMAIDRNSIIQNVGYGLSTICTGPFPKYSWANNPIVKPWPYDPGKSKQYLKQDGWKMGPDGILYKTINGKRTPFKFTLLFVQGGSTAEKVATIVQQQLKLVGISVELQSHEWATHETQYIKPRKYEAFVGAWSINLDPDCYQLFHSSQMGENQFNLLDYKNSRVDELLVEGLRTLDVKKRQKIYWQLHKILNDEQPCTFLSIPCQLSAIHKRFKGYEMSMVGLTHPEKWYVPLSQQKYNP